MTTAAGISMTKTAAMISM